MSVFDQAPAACRCEWGVAGVDGLAPADVIIVVDVLSFTSCVDVAVSRGVAVLPFQWRDARAADFAAAQRAVLAQKRSTSAYSLSPTSFLEAPRGLRCVLPSPNGAVVALRAAAKSAIVLAASLRNASAVAVAAAKLGATFNVCPAGERWADGSLRPSVEDWIAAGAVLKTLPGTKSPEARAAIAAFEAVAPRFLEAISSCSSGRELISRGYPGDVKLAAAYDVSTCVPRLEEGAFVGDAT
ncbi:MAG: 2-phosphosulfolactate phosphatase [Gemmatimonadaceae bacterium]